MGVTGVIATAVVLLPMIYVASFGPAVWLMDRSRLIGAPFVAGVYQPVIWTAFDGPESARRLIRWYALWGISPSTRYAEVPVVVGGSQVLYVGGILERLRDAAQISEE